MTAGPGCRRFSFSCPRLPPPPVPGFLPFAGFAGLKRGRYGSRYNFRPRDLRLPASKSQAAGARELCGFLGSARFCLGAPKIHWRTEK
ncbi:MAG: hypothetical protein C6W56_14775 [Caldibacillus debilis]|nr:MAG: hypothetical protein C6W56_14775 [Caldibacillus debilis]